MRPTNTGGEKRIETVLDHGRDAHRRLDLA
jgi:hypothetical protein